MFKTIALVVGAVLVVGIAGVLAYAATRPDTFTLQRSASIKASPDKIYPFISDFHNWGAWSPWEKMDPELKRTYSGAPSGAGTVYAWEGNRKVGQGRMEIIEASPPSKVTLKLDFVRPFEAHNQVDFVLEPRGESTDITWKMQGPQPYFAKVIGVVFNMDKMVGKDFESGLANLKAAAEK
ncbi:MAG: polyketide cyclase [Rhizobiales bacterium]|nr:polyketide cyclase [Hyphomicrobiales bacterium]